MRKFLLSGVALLAFGGAAHATSIFSGEIFFSSLVGAPAGTGTGSGGTAFGGGGSVGGTSNPQGNVAAPLITFFTAATSNLMINVRDISLVGDVFQVALDGSFVGETSHQAVNTSSGTNSTGSFIIHNLPAGLHQIGVEDLILSYEGEGSPFGGSVPSGGPESGNPYDPAAAFARIDAFAPGAPLPEPMSAALIGAGLIGLGAARRRRKK